jgi:Xaa-Pro aminopeptidase
VKPAINKLKTKLLKHKLEALLITSKINVAYLTGFTGEGQLIATPTQQVLIVDFRFREQAKKEVDFCQIYQTKSFRPLEENISEVVKKLKLKKLAFQPSSLSYEFYCRLKKILNSVELHPTANIVDRLRAIKDTQEIKLLKKAAHCAMQSFAFAQRIVKPGKRETDIASRLYLFIKKLGVDSLAFDTIVASGKRGSMPHAPVSNRTIKNNEAVLLDLGCRISGYNSDLTRMIFLGKITEKIKCIYNIVLQAQRLAISTVRAGVKICQIDNIARNYIAKAGLGSYFGHALGHGIGREVHEYPFISPKNHNVLEEGMVFTIEPGIYIPGVGGIRIEDMVLVTKTGYEVLTR